MKLQPASKPSSSALAIYWRLLRSFARPYWFQLLIGVSAGILMGGAMSAYLRFMDLGINALESGYAQKMHQSETGNQSIKDRLLQSRTIRWLMEVTDTSFTADALDARPPEPVAMTEEAAADQPSAPHSQQTKKKPDGIFAQINAITTRLGFDVSEDEQLTFPLVCLLIGVMFFYFLLKSFGEFVNRYFLRWVGARVVADIRQALFDTLQKQSLAFFSKNDVGQLISRCTNDTASIESAFANSIAELCTAPVLVLVAFQFILQKAIAINLLQPTFFLLLAMPLCIIPVLMISRYVRKYQRRVLARVSDLVASMQENFSGIRVVKAFNTEQDESRRFRAQNRSYFKSVVKALLADVFMQPTMQMTAIGIGSLFLIICYHYQVSLGSLAVIGYAAQQAYKPIKELAKLNSHLQRSAAATERVFELLDTDTSLPVSENPIILTDFHQHIQMDHLSFSYDEGGPVVLKDFSATIPKGHLVALVGHTGSGKSTIANLLARFYDPCQGAIRIDGHDLRDLDLPSFRRMVGIVAQDTFLFNTTIAENIRYGSPQAGMDEVIAAAKQANAHEFIIADPLGYERPVGERGVLLSGGQKQRIAIARALLKNPPILILDEATSALDTATEKLVQEAIAKLMAKRTVIAIAHRLSTIRKADNIIVLDHGQICEQGTHDELYARNGSYRALYDLQLSKDNNPNSNA
ncbi:MAG: ABC transporter ATP-binding protein [Lentisphaerae bacterium]|nr:ABC transporter ATP-binding protein [Lentisphaerota bacterium]